MPAAAPLIGLTTYAPSEENGGHVSLPPEYIAAIRRSGGMPLLIPPGESATAMLLDRVDALVLAGGGDIDPVTYGGDRHGTVYMVDEDRDRTELDLVKDVLDREIPTLAICRGIQILNVALGGTLHTHLPDVVGEEVKHRAPPRNPVAHDVTVQPDCHLARIMEATEVCPMSWHHQAIDQVAEPLRVVAQARDGVIEAVDLLSHPFFIAVQWHPELTADRDVTQQRLFDALVSRALENED